MRKPKHYLLTLPLGPGAHLHAYVITDDDKRTLPAVMDEMMKVAEPYASLVPIMLQTELGDGVSVVREIICRMSAEAAELLRTATRFHRSVFAFTGDHPDDERLMALH